MESWLRKINSKKIITKCVYIFNIKNCESRGDLGAPCWLEVKQPRDEESAWKASLEINGRRCNSSHRSGSLPWWRGSLQVFMITESAHQEMLSEKRKGKMSSFVNWCLVGGIKLEGRSTVQGLGSAASIHCFWISEMLHWIPMSTDSQPAACECYSQSSGNRNARLHSPHQSGY